MWFGLIMRRKDDQRAQWENVPGKRFETGPEAARAAKEMTAATHSFVYRVKSYQDDGGVSWKQREANRLVTAYKRLPWSNEEWWRLAISPAGVAENHFAHVAKSNPTQVAYTPDAEFGAADRQLSIKAGRYLNRFFGDKLPTLEVRKWAKAMGDNEDADELHLATTPEDIHRVYTTGPHSCMSWKVGYENNGSDSGGGDCCENCEPRSHDNCCGYCDGEDGCTAEDCDCHTECQDDCCSCHESSGNVWPDHIHPVTVYGAGDLAVGYIIRGNRITARAICWPAKKVFGRLYGDENRLARAFEAAGYSRAKPSDWVGAKLVRKVHRHSYIVPYLDIAPWFVDKKTHLEICADTEARRCGGQSTDGVAGSDRGCPRCKEPMGDHPAEFMKDGKWAAWCRPCAEEVMAACDRCGHWTTKESVRPVRARNCLETSHVCPSCFEGWYKTKCGGCQVAIDNDGAWGELCFACAHDRQTYPVLLAAYDHYMMRRWGHDYMITFRLPRWCRERQPDLVAYAQEHMGRGHWIEPPAAPLQDETEIPKRRPITTADYGLTIPITRVTPRWPRD